MKYTLNGLIIRQTISLINLIIAFALKYPGAAFAPKINTVGLNSLILPSFKIGNSWITNLDSLKNLEKYQDDNTVLKQFDDIKKIKKRQLADYILQQEGITINPDFIFDIQVKRLHEYKRQLLNAFSILDIYFGLKDGFTSSSASINFAISLINLIIAFALKYPGAAFAPKIMERMMVQM